VNDLTHSRRNRIDLISKSERLRELVLRLAKELNLSRRRKYSNGQFILCCEHLEIVLLDLLSASDGDPFLYIGYSRGKNNFLKGGAYWDDKEGQAILSSSHFLTVIDFLEECGLIENHIAKAGRNERSSRMRATPALRELFEEKKLNWASILINPRSPIIIVKDENKKKVAYPEVNNFDLSRSIKNLQRINANLQTSLINLSISDDDFRNIQTRMLSNEGNEDNIFEAQEVERSIEFSDRSLKRIFALNSFDNGGRFYGGWWQSIPSEYRKYIEIEGLMTVEMDFSTIQPRILYADVGHPAPLDSYILPNWNYEIAGINLRHVVKKAFNQLINSSETSRNERQWHRFAPDLVLAQEPDGWREMSKPQKRQLQTQLFHEITGKEYRELLKDLLEFHKPIENKFFQAHGELCNLLIHK